MKDPALVARAILADPRFRPHGAAPQHTKSLFERALDWLRTTWEHLIENVARQVHVSKTATNVAGDVLLVALVVVILAVIARLLFSISRDAPAGRTTLVQTEDARNAADLYADALALGAAGAYAKAAAALYRAALALLGERGIIRESSSATVGDVQRALRRADRAVSSEFTPIAHRFSDAAYAESPVDANGWNDALAAYRRLAQRGEADA